MIEIYQGKAVPKNMGIVEKRVPIKRQYSVGKGQIVLEVGKKM